MVPFRMGGSREMKLDARQFLTVVRGNRRMVRVAPEGTGYRIDSDGESWRVEWLENDSGEVCLLIDGVPRETVVQTDGKGSYRVSLASGEITVEVAHGLAGRIARAAATGPQNGPLEVRSPMHGLVVQVPVRAGDLVQADTPLVVLEAMKMQNAITSPGPSVVRRVLVSPGQTVEGEALLVVLERRGDAEEAAR